MASVLASMSRLQRIAVITIGVVVVLVLLGWIVLNALRPHLPTAAETTARAKEVAALQGGALVFATHCAYCHLKGIGPTIAGLALQIDTVKTFVRSGPNSMPAFPPSQVSDSDIAEVTQYINGLPPVASNK